MKSYLQYKHLADHIELIDNLCSPGSERHFVNGLRSIRAYTDPLHEMHPDFYGLRDQTIVAALTGHASARYAIVGRSDILGKSTTDDYIYGRDAACILSELMVDQWNFRGYLCRPKTLNGAVVFLIDRPSSLLWQLGLTPEVDVIDHLVQSFGLEIRTQLIHPRLHPLEGGIIKID